MMKRFICGAFACFIALTVVHAQSASGQRVYNPALFKALEWRSIGPYRGGRVTAVAGVPGQPLVYYMGATGGGVWKTEDAGLTWNPITDDFVKTGSVGAIASRPRTRTASTSGWVKPTSAAISPKID
jgi:hypothetical protein